MKISASPKDPRKATQRGVYALEYALVFLVFFGILYALIAYGVLLTLRAGMQNAAEDGARAGLRYQIAAGGNSQLDLRKKTAKTIATQQIEGWLPGTTVVQAEICNTGTDTCTLPACGLAWSERCEIVVTITTTGMSSIFPIINFAIPEKLESKASVAIDGRAL